MVQQFQFRTVVALSCVVIVMHAWLYIHAEAMAGAVVLFAITQSVLFWSPLLMVLFLDAIKRQSKLFRIAMPVAYLMFVGFAYIRFGYIQSTPIMPDTNSKLLATGLTFEGQIAGALYSIMFLMLTYLGNAFSDASGTAVLFPLNVTTVLKNALPFILEGGGLMQTEVDVDNQRVVLVPKARAIKYRSSASLRMATVDDEEDLLTLPVIVPPPRPPQVAGDEDSTQLFTLSAQ